MSYVPAMAMLRKLIFGQRPIAALLLVVALCLKAAIPAGYMIEAGSRTLTVLVCSDSEHRQTTMKLVVPSTPSDDDARHQEEKGAGLCPFAGISAPALVGPDALLLASAIAFVMAAGFLATPAPEGASAEHLRPPLRGPPALL